MAKGPRLLRVGVLASTKEEADRVALRLDVPWIDTVSFLFDSPTLHEDLNFAGVSALVARVDPGFGVKHLLEHLEATGHGDRPVVVVTDEARDAPWCHAFRMGIVDLVPGRKLTEAALRGALLESPQRLGFMRGNGAFREVDQLVSSLVLFRRTGVLELKGEQGPARLEFRWGRVTAAPGVALDEQGRPRLPADAPWTFTEVAPPPPAADHDEPPLLDAELDEPPLLEAALAPLTAADVDPSKVSLLVVDDDPTVLHLLKESFSRRGFKVVAAPGGAEALLALAQQRFDAAVLDLDMPRVDGWTVLGAMREDPRTWDTQVLLFSAHDQFREVLARSGPASHLALPKATRIGVLERHVRELLLPRLELERRLAACGVGCELALPHLEGVGVGWLVRALERHRVTASLSGKTAVATFTLWFVDGRLVQARGQLERAQLFGPDALKLLLAQRPKALHLGDATVPPGEGFGGATTSDIVEAAVNRLAVELHHVGQLAVAAAVSIRFDDALYELLQHVGAPLLRHVAKALRVTPATPAALAGDLGLPPETIVSALRELVRRGVVTVSSAGPPVLAPLTRAA